LTLGLNDSLTGPGAVYGLPQANAVKMAAEEINAKGGIKAGGDTYKLNVIAYDDKANPTEGTNAVRKLIDRDSAQYIVGFCCSGPTSAVASFIGKEKVLMLVGNAAERSITTLGAPNLLRTRPPADFTGAAAGTFVASKGAKNIAVIGSLDVGFYTQYLEAFEKEFANFCEVRHCIGVANGLDALSLILRAYDVGPGDDFLPTEMDMSSEVELLLVNHSIPIKYDEFVIGILYFFKSIITFFLLNENSFIMILNGRICSPGMPCRFTS
jgi:hypothetical protein